MKVKFAGLGFTIFSCKIFKNEKKESNLFRLMKIHEKNYIHHDLHSGNILSYDVHTSLVGDLGLCQQVVDKKDNQNKIFGVIPYLAPEVLSKKT